MLHVNPLLCPIAALGAALLAQHHIWKRLEPRLERRDLWWNMHVYCSLHGRNQRGPLSRDVMDNDVRRVFREALGWSEEAYERDMKGISARLCRKTNARETSFSVPEREGERLGMWSGRDETRRDTHYLKTTPPFLAARAMAGTPGPDPLTLHITDWVPGAIKIPGVVPSADETLMRYEEPLPSVPMAYVAELLPWAAEWYERLNDDSDEAWSQEGADSQRVSARNYISAVVLSVKAYICAMSVLHESFPDNALFKHVLSIATPPLRNFLDDNNRRYRAAQDVSQVAKELEFVGKKAEAQALRCVEGQMQALASEHRSMNAEMRGEIHSSEHKIMGALFNLQT
jgi:hypothetical protein